MVHYLMLCYMECKTTTPEMYINIKKQRIHVPHYLKVKLNITFETEDKNTIKADFFYPIKQHELTT